MDSNVSRLSYETFKSALQNDNHQINDVSPKVVNSTVMAGSSVIKESSKSETEKNEIPRIDIVRRKIIPLPLPYRCQECGKEFRKIENLRIHFMNHLTSVGRGTLPYICRHGGCNRRFPNKQEGKNHELRHVAAGKFNCERIQNVFKYK